MGVGVDACCVAAGVGVEVDCRVAAGVGVEVDCRVAIGVEVEVVIGVLITMGVEIDVGSGFGIGSTTGGEQKWVRAQTTSPARMSSKIPISSRLARGFFPTLSFWNTLANLFIMVNGA